MPSRIRKTIREGKRFLITSHIDPDGDALGSVFSLYWAMKSLGKEPLVYLKDRVPYRYDFLPRPADIVHVLPQDAFDAVFVLDCGNLFRVGDGHEHVRSLGPIVCIDHHDTNEAFGTINVVDTHASSTGEILYGLYHAMNIDFTYDMAVNIYTAVFTDTGSLRFENAGVRAFAVCEKMVEAGVRPSDVAGMVYENHPKERFLLLGEVLRTLRTFDNDRIAFVHITEEMFEKTGTTREQSDGFVEEIKQIRGVEAAVLIRQAGERRYKISMRAKGTVDVARICGLWGGGGHKNAAGCHIDGDLTAVEKELKKAFKIV